MSDAGNQTSTVTSTSTTSSSFPEMTSSKTSILSLKLYVVIAILCFFTLVVSLFIFFYLRYKRASSKRDSTRLNPASGVIPLVSKEIVEIKSEKNGKEEVVVIKKSEINESAAPVLVVSSSGGASSSNNNDGEKTTAFSTGESDEVLVGDQVQPDLGWGRWYSLRELEIATRGFCDENVIGEGGYGIVYRGVFRDGSVVAVKNLLNNKGQAEKEFKVEVEAIGKVRHKNLVGLIGYCVEGTHRMLVYEYIDNGNLEQWLHGDVGPVSPLTWDIRMKIAIGTAKGLAYLHEGLEPKVVHRDIKSSNILLDRKWNAKVSDFGLAKLLGPETSYVTTRVMGTFGYVSPDYASTGMLNEASDVYSFGVLLMEIITGRSPVDYSRPPGEVNLVDWLKGMVASRRGDEVIDPLIEVKPSSRALKRVILVCLRCIDLDANKRPKMGQIVHILEADDFPFRSELKSARQKESLPPLAAAPDKVSYTTRHARAQ